MIRHAVTALAAALALSACSKTEEKTAVTADPMAEGTATTVGAAPVATETVVATPGATMTANDGTTTVTAGPNGTSVTVDGKDVDATVGPDGVRATVAPGN